mmetsp:Transcript_24843/g.36642  ORF Transcript_24843/g.36642 Transcript_24843/m.36642 type:complete len:561 (-) Transcript_24843:188-1870(-)
MSSKGIHLLVGCILAVLSLCYTDGSDLSYSTRKCVLVIAESDYIDVQVFTWNVRLFDASAPPISRPRSKPSQSDRLYPGVVSFLSEPASTRFRSQLLRVIASAQEILSEHDTELGSYPLYAVLGDGSRALSPIYQKRILSTMRNVFSNSTLSPFHFQDDFVQMLSGEEEAAFHWTAVNHALDILLPSYGRRQLSHTLGVIYLGDSSTHIAFSRPVDMPLAEGAYRVQLAGSAHWDLYVRAYTSYGFENIRSMHLANVADAAADSVSEGSAVVPRALEYCFYAGYSESVLTSISPRKSVEVHGPSVPAGDQLARCMDGISGQFHTKRSAYCQDVYGGQCGLAGAYQPSLAGHNGVTKFVVSGLIKYSWQLLKMPGTSSLEKLKEKATKLCSMSFSDLVLYDAGLTDVIKDQRHAELLPYSCFLAGYMVTLLEDGYDFIGNSTFTLPDGSLELQMSWSHGFMLREVNSYPVYLETEPSVEYWGKVLLALCIGIIIGGMCTGCIARRLFGNRQGWERSSQVGEYPRSNSSSPWPARISQFNPFKQREYDIIPDGDIDNTSNYH